MLQLDDSKRSSSHGKPTRNIPDDEVMTSARANLTQNIGDAV